LSRHLISAFIADGSTVTVRSKAHLPRAHPHKWRLLLRL
jgi:hypothetical protein